MPWEEGSDEAHERKSLKYQDFIKECRVKGWQLCLFPLEVESQYSHCKWHSLHSEFQKMSGRQLYAGLWKQQKEPLMGSGIKGRCRVGSVEVVGRPSLLTCQMEGVAVKG